MEPISGKLQNRSLVLVRIYSKTWEENCFVPLPPSPGQKHLGESPQVTDDDTWVPLSLKPRQAATSAHLGRSTFASTAYFYLHTTCRSSCFISTIVLFHEKYLSKGIWITDSNVHIKELFTVQPWKEFCLMIILFNHNLKWRVGEWWGGLEITRSQYPVISTQEAVL